MGACSHEHRPLPDGAIQEIQGLLKLRKDGHVERLPAMPDVPCTWPAATCGADVTSFDVKINAATGVWARLYAPNPRQTELPLLVYFHGGGFCVGSASWRCYHEFLARLAAATAGFAIVSVNYRLAPEHRLPAAFDDGLEATKWLRQQASCGAAGELGVWQSRCDFSRVFLGGDSAGGAIAYHVAAQLGAPEWLKGAVLIQPFFGGERRRTSSEEKSSDEKTGSALTLEASDLYWRLALPAGADRDHPWCNPLSKSCSPRLDELKLPAVLVCVADKDLLKDRNLKFCEAMERTGKRVECAVYGGVGHAFQVFGKSHESCGKDSDRGDAGHHHSQCEVVKMTIIEQKFYINK